MKTQANPQGAVPGSAAGRSAQRPSSAAEFTREHLLRFLLVAFQFGLLILTVRAFGIESKAFLHLIVFSFFGFLANHFVPPRHRMRFFAAFSLGGIVLIFGALNAAWIILPGIALIALAHVPAPFAVRVSLVCAAAVLLGVLRTNPSLSPIPNALWPILGSMFMFRMMMYLYELKQGRVPFSVEHAISYFFMLPNVCFPMFPLVDYKSFCDSHYNGAPLDIYQKGLHWCFQGVLHILLYRIIYQNIVVDPSTIVDASGAARHIASNYLVYLRFTGSFHLIIGLLALFGFNLPRVFHYWLLASGFTDLWRRVNIYWKNFIQKLVFYPAHFWLKGKVGPNATLAIATVFTFVLTWALHSYQFFWIRGEFPIIVQDIVFWGVIGVGVYANLLIEAKFGRKRSLKREPDSWRVPLIRSLKTVAMFTFMCLAWTYWMAESPAEAWHIVSSLARLTPWSAAGILALLLAVGVAAAILGGKPADPPAARKPADKKPARTGLPGLMLPVLPTLSIAIALLVVANYPLVFSFSPKLVEIADNIRSGSRLSAKDSKAMERGYYEDLTNVSRFNDELAEIMTSMPPDWNVNPGVKANPGQFPPFEFLPSVSVPYKGATLTTNSWAMHDREYTKEKPPGTFRIALLGSSHTVGIGVDRSQTYENLVEDRLNSEFAKGSGLRFEILNAAVSGYGPMCGLTTFERKLGDFQPDALMIGGMDDLTWIINETVNAAVKSLPVPYEPIARIISEAGVPNGTPQTLAEQRLNPHAREMLAWVYQRYIAIAAERGVIPLATVLPRPEELTERFRTLDAEQAAMMKEAGFVLIDSYDAYAGVEDPSKLWIRKYDRHPDAVGHQMLADAIYASLTRELTALGVLERGRAPAAGVPAEEVPAAQ